MSDQPLTGNERVAQTIVSKLKEAKLISNEETVLEKKIANGTVKENDWKVLFETKLREQPEQSEGEAE